MTASPDVLIGRTLDGRYRIESISARGGMATIYLASDLRLRREVAIKVMHASLAEDPSFIARFEREARAAASLTHPNVVAVHDQGRDPVTGTVYLVMEYVSGHTVRDVLNARKALTPTQSLAVIEPVIAALTAAHAAGFVHRDIKPENIMISDDGRIKVTDFGLARAIDDGTSTATTRGVLIGTVAYLSPEHVERGEVDARSDLYSAGIVLFEMLTGKVPHAGDTPIAVAFQHVHGDVPAPSSVNPALTAVLDGIVLTATARDREARFQSAEDMQREVRRVRDLIERGQFSSAPLHIPSAQHSTEVIDRETPASQHLTEIENSMTEPQRPRRERTKESRKRSARKPRQPRESRATRTETEQTDRPRRRKLAVPIFLIAVVALAGFFFVKSSQATSVPQLVGKTADVAIADLANRELTGVIAFEKYSDTVPTGVVISAQPSSGESVTKGSTVELTVSKGPEKFTIPSVSGQSVTDATAAITKASLTVEKTQDEFHPTVEAGFIIRTEPAAGKKLTEGGRVTLIVSKGQEPVKLPALKGLTEEEARSALASAGFTQVKIKREYSTTIELNRVSRADPKPGSKQLPSVTVTVFLSDGPEPVEVPNVVDKSKKTAFELLENAGLTPAISSSNTCKTGYKISDSKVLQQSVAGGTTVSAGTTVSLGVFYYCSKK